LISDSSQRPLNILNLSTINNINNKNYLETIRLEFEVDNLEKEKALTERRQKGQKNIFEETSKKKNIQVPPLKGFTNNKSQNDLTFRNGDSGTEKTTQRKEFFFKGSSNLQRKHINDLRK
jgi:hypothetical protein